VPQALLNASALLDLPRGPGGRGTLGASKRSGGTSTKLPHLPCCSG
jgi:hypothetical protein